MLSFVVGGPLSCGLFYFINFNKFENRLPIYILNFNVDSTTFNSRLNDSVLFRYCSSYNLVSRSTKRKPPWLTQPHDSMTASLFYLYSWDDPTLSTSLRPPSTIVRRKRTKCKPLHAKNKNCILPNDYSKDIHLFNHLIDDFCNSFDPINYFKLHSTFTISDLPIAATSFAANPAIDVIADDLLSSQQCSRGSHRY